MRVVFSILWQTLSNILSFSAVKWIQVEENFTYKSKLRTIRYFSANKNTGWDGETQLCFPKTEYMDRWVPISFSIFLIVLVYKHKRLQVLWQETAPSALCPYKDKKFSSWK